VYTGAWLAIVVLELLCVVSVEIVLALDDKV
jgi:hypothetical protein